VRAEAAESEGRFADAQRYLSRYVRFRPGDTDALAALGVLVDDTADSPQEWHQAYNLFERVLIHSPERRDIRRRFVDVAMKLGLYETALDHLRELNSNASDDDRAELAFLIGECRHAEGRYAEAIRHYLEAIEHDGTQVDPYARLAYLVTEHPGELLGVQRVTARPRQQHFLEIGVGGTSTDYLGNVLVGYDQGCDGQVPVYASSEHQYQIAGIEARYVVEQGPHHRSTMGARFYGGTDLQHELNHPRRTVPEARTQIWGINTYFKLDRRWFGFGAGLHLGQLLIKPDRDDENLRRLMPMLIHRIASTPGVPGPPTNLCGERNTASR
jgi:tetratricopeptide (TPR) repeat protein